jgi:hypothetical protein
VALLHISKLCNRLYEYFFSGAFDADLRTDWNEATNEYHFCHADKKRKTVLLWCSQGLLFFVLPANGARNLIFEAPEAVRRT